MKTSSTMMSCAAIPDRGAARKSARGRGAAPLAGKSHAEPSRARPGDGATGRYHKIGHDGAAIEALFVDVFLECARQAAA